MAEIVNIINLSGNGPTDLEVITYSAAGIQFVPSGGWDGTITITGSVNQQTAPVTVPMQTISGGTQNSILPGEMPTVRFCRLVTLRSITFTVTGWTTGTLQLVVDLTDNPLVLPLPVPVSVADGSDIAEGTTTDAAVTGDTAGTVNAHLRGILKTLGAPVSLGSTILSPVTSALIGCVSYFRNLSTGWYQIPGIDTFSSGGMAPGDGVKVNSYPTLFNADNGFNYPDRNARSVDGVADSSNDARGIAASGNILLASHTEIRERTPDTFRTAAAVAAGNTALWTPAAGKKFRLMRFIIEITDNATLAVAGVLQINLFDGAAGNINQTFDIFVPAAALVNNGLLYSSGWTTLDNGILSVAANNVLNINLSAALVTGNVRVRCCGTEE